MEQNRIPPPDVLQDRTMEVETPEHVSIEYPLAGLGSRFAALLADFTIILLLLIGGMILAGFAANALSLSPGTVMAFLVLYSFVLFWGYFFLQEAFRDGLTLGKKLLSIRVVMDGGYPITLEAAAIRNLIRIVDLIGGGLVGGFFMLLSRRAKRLGDMAASTVVVRELPVQFPEVAEIPESAAPPRLSPEAFLALEKYIERRSALAMPARQRIARDISQRLFPLEKILQGETEDQYLVRFHAEESARHLAAHMGGRAGSVHALSLIRSKRERWEEFRRIFQKARWRKLSLEGENAVSNFAARYRELSADLARARTYGASPETIYALERLVGAGHNLFYRPAQQSIRRALDFVARGFPRLVRKRWIPVMIAAVFLYLPTFLSYSLLRARPELEPQMVPVEMIARAEEAPGRRAGGAGYIDVPLSHGFLASAIISNNLQVSFLAFGLGVTAGIGTLLILIVNGLHLGSVLAIFHNREVLDVIGLFVLPHGIIELTAICIAGGAGIWMGSGLLLPGRKTRMAAFSERAREAVYLIAGVILLLICAGLIEGFISPVQFASPLKLGFSALAAAALAGYLLTAGRGKDQVKAPRAA